MLNQKTRSDLELDRFFEALAARCRTPMGRARARGITLPTSHEETLHRLHKGAECTTLFANGEVLPITGAADVGDALGRIEAAGVLGPQELLGLVSVLGQVRALRRFLATRKERAPLLAANLSTDPTLDAVEDEVRAAFDTDGLLADHASPRLRELRGEVKTTRARLQSRLEEIARRYGSIMQDDFVTEREGRIVVPVRADAHERFPGIVHATSASGSTLFVEPRVLVPMGNRLKVLEGEVAREEIVIYTRLSALYADALPSLIAAVDVLAEADVLRATCELAGELELRWPRIVPEARLRLRAARHVLLALDGIDVVPSDLEIESGHAVVVSGPNAGGKTVALKAMGLAALLTRAGLPIAAHEESEMGLFDVVLTDVGDDQSLQKNLSTFSAHIRNLVTVLDGAGPRALVLLDELAGGTDPREGEALAAGVLGSLTARGAAVVCTTHYEGLKALALGDPRFTNASVGFDKATLTPTFQLLIGVPGASSAIAVARRFGLPSTVIERAESFLDRDDRTFEELVQRLHDERKGLEQAKLAFDERRAELERAQRALEVERDTLRAKHTVALGREFGELREGILRAREGLRNAQAQLRAKPKTKEELRSIERNLERVGRDVAAGLAEVEPARGDGGVVPGADELKRGAKVFAPRLRKEVEVLEVMGEDVRVAAGALKLTLKRHELRRRGGSGDADERHAAPRRASSPSPGAAVPGPDVAIQTSGNTCDLRGLRVEDALSMASSFLDRALGSGERIVFLVHGHGTGALRDALRKELAAQQHVKHFRAGGPGEGGDGATLAWLD